MATSDVVHSSQRIGANASPNPLSSLHFESFETFLQNLAPVRLSEDAGVPTDAMPQIALNLHSSSGGNEETAGDESKLEIKRLQELVELLQVRLDAVQSVLEIQEQEVCKGMVQQGDPEMHSAYEKLLTRWRREVCIMLLKQRVDALQVEQRQLQHTQKEQHLTVQLHEARALVEVLKQKERNLNAEISILTTSTKMAEMTMKAEGARRQHEMGLTVKGATRAAAEAITHVLESHSGIISQQFERISDAACRLDMHGRRLFFAEQQVAMVAGLMSSELKSQGAHSHRRKREAEFVAMDPRRDWSVVDQTGRANQLEVLLAATKTQLADECLHARDLQERLARSEVEARESTRRATKRAQEQADRDLAAIKRQHVQAMQSLQQKLMKLQTEQAKSIVAHHQLERRLSQQQQEFTQTLNQKEIEFKISLDAKEAEVNGLLVEQNALLIKLKKFWRPILTSPSAKILSEKTPRVVQQSPQEISSSLAVRAEDSKQGKCLLQSVETQTEEVIEKKKCKVSIQDEYQESDSTQDVEIVPDPKARIRLASRLSTPIRKCRLKSRPRKNDDDLISSYLTKLQKAYVKSGDLSARFMSSQSLDSLMHRDQEDSLPSTSLPMLSANNDGKTSVHTSRSSMESKEFTDLKHGSVPQYIICVPHHESLSASGNAFYLRTRKKKRPVDSRCSLRNKLENLEALSVSLLNQGHRL